MSIAAAFAVPHPVICLPRVGNGEQRRISNTIDALREMGRRVAVLKPDAIVVFTPHATAYCDYIHISPGTGASGNFAKYGDAGTVVGTAYDRPLVRAICEEAYRAHVHAGTSGEKTPELDHGTMIPLHFIHEAGEYAPIVRVSTSDLTDVEHYRLGECIARAAKRLGRRVVVIASGDMSHRLHHSSPYGFEKEGPEFDRTMCGILASGDFGSLFTLDPRVAEHAVQCCLTPLLMMAGTLDGMIVTSDLMSYEGSVGVGYAVTEFQPLSELAVKERKFGDIYEKSEIKFRKEMRRKEDAYVTLARRAVENWARSGAILEPDEYVTDDLPEELTTTRAGAFVAVRKGDSPRGYMGTLEPTRETLADEIVHNAVTACSRDERFPSVTVQELPMLNYWVDILGEPELVSSVDELDPTRYGVIVSTPDGRRGSVLPDEDDILSVDEQVDRACRRGGIDPQERITLQRFEVTRHQ
ncbi:MAG: AmmeMemoRadiSam system protein B [Coriobacteriales bacterium]|jgi:aromatic ring-opening dioxygenase LigB subunit/AMMECR1 domain-containing protein